MTLIGYGVFAIVVLSCFILQSTVLINSMRLL